MQNIDTSALAAAKAKLDAAEAQREEVYVMIVTLIVTARFVHIYNQIFNSCLK